MNIDYRMAWRNIWRNPRRSVLTMSAIAFACILVVFMLSFQFGSYDTMIDFSVRINSGYLQIQAPDYQDKRDMQDVVADPQAIARMLDEVPGISAYTFRAGSFALVSSEKRTYGVMVVGIDPEREALVSTLKTFIRKGNYLSSQDTPAVLVGELLAENLRVNVGDELVLLGQGRDGSMAASVLTVAGTFRSGQDDFDRNTMHIPLTQFQEIFSMGGAVHETVIVGENLDDLPRLKAAVISGVEGIETKESLRVLDWMELMPGLIQGIQMDLYSGLIFYFILIIVVAFSILNTFLMAILERTREFGVMMALGTKPRRLVSLLLTESMTITAMGIGLGVVIGAALTLYYQSAGISMGDLGEMVQQYGIPERIYPKLSLGSISIGPAAIFIITFFAALYPALKVRRLKPNTAQNKG